MAGTHAVGQSEVELGDKLRNGHHLVNAGQAEADAISVACAEGDVPQRGAGLQEQEAQK